VHSKCYTMGFMKIAQLPPVRVTPSVREHIESVLHEGESLSQFVEKATLDAANRRIAQQAFIARGRASLSNARQTGELYAADDVLLAMRDRLNARVAALKKDVRAKNQQA
jgi:hypothetical protein